MNKPKYWQRVQMVLNLFDFQFSTAEKEVLSFGLKFAIGIPQNIITNTILPHLQELWQQFFPKASSKELF